MNLVLLFGVKLQISFPFGGQRAFSGVPKAHCGSMSILEKCAGVHFKFIRSKLIQIRNIIKNPGSVQRLCSAEPASIVRRSPEKKIMRIIRIKPHGFSIIAAGGRQYQ